jgi:hypothetical protein
VPPKKESNVNSGVIKAFLASVGFKADQKSLKTALATVAVFSAGVKLATAAIYSATMKAAEGEAELAGKAEQLGTTTDKLREMEYAASESGVSLDKVTGAMEALVKKNPRIRDGAKALELFSARLKGLSEPQRRLYAQRMGIDTSLIPMLTSDLSSLRQEFKTLSEASGMDGKRSAEAAKGVTAEWGKLLLIGKLLGKSALLPFMERLRDRFQRLRKWMLAIAGTIRTVMSTVLNIIGRLSDAINKLLSRALDMAVGFAKLTTQSKQAVHFFVILAAAVAFVLAPMLMLVAVVAGLILLWEDFQTFAEGGESYFDWKWVKELQKAFADLRQKWEALKTSIRESAIGKLLGWDKADVDRQSRFTAGAGIAEPDVFMPWRDRFPPAFAGAGPVDNSIHVESKSEFYVSSTDPEEAGREVEAAQKRANADLARNMRSRVK